MSAMTAWWANRTPRQKTAIKVVGGAAGALTLATGVVALGPIVASALAAALAEGGAIATLSAGGAVVAVGKAAVEVARRT